MTPAPNGARGFPASGAPSIAGHPVRSTGCLRGHGRFCLLL